MTVSLNEKFSERFVSAEEIKAFEPKAKAAFDTLMNGSGEGNDFLGWRELPANYDKAEFARIKAAAKRIQDSCDVFIVIGIGGSYLGSRAVIEYIKSPNYNLLAKKTPNIYFIGNSISASALSETLALCEGKDVCVNVISKSGTTTEPAIAFRIFRALLEKKYGADGATSRIFATTDKARGTLKEFSDEKGYETFVIPDDVGGRYSVLTACGLLPIAVAGCDIDALMNGACRAMKELSVFDIEKNPAVRYAVIRNILNGKGKTGEIMACYEPAYALMNEWWKQLFGESEGKDGKGIFPASVIYSTDLHSLGQIVQSGVRNIFETVINIADTGVKYPVPMADADIDGLNYLAGRDMNEINKTAYLATAFAHSDGDVPNLVLEVADRKEDTLGYLLYFFMISCAVSGYILGVNPFNQPGVEAYKNNMFALLGKPNPKYDELRAKLKARM